MYNCTIVQFANVGKNDPDLQFPNYAEEKGAGIKICIFAKKWPGTTICKFYQKVLRNDKLCILQKIDPEWKFTFLPKMIQNDDLQLL